MSTLSAPLSFFSKPKDLDVLVFTKHLATMIGSGISITEALSSISEETKNSAFRKIIDDILSKVTNGDSLSHAMGSHKTTFGDFYISLIEISEESGTLDENLDFIAKQLAKNYSLKKKIQGAMLYPTLILISTTIMGGFIAFFILPQLVDFFAAFNVDLPITTKVLLFVANAFKYYGIIIVGCIAAFFIFLKLLTQTPMFKPVFHTILLKLPILGPFILSAQLAQFSRNFGILIKSGVPISKSIPITAKTLSNVIISKDLLRIGTSLTKGKSIAQTLKEEKFWEFPSLVTKMISVGERTGKLDESLLYLGEYYEEEIDTFSKNLTTIIEPILLIGIGLMVGFVALAIITPIYQFTGSIGR